MLTISRPPASSGDSHLAPTVLESRLLPDGRVGAVFVKGEPVAEAIAGARKDRAPELYIFVQVGDRWLIDQEIIGFKTIPVVVAEEELASPLAGTPLSGDRSPVTR